MYVESMTNSISYSFKLDADFKVVISPVEKPIMNEYKNHHFKEILIFFFLFQKHGTGCVSLGQKGELDFVIGVLLCNSIFMGLC